MKDNFFNKKISINFCMLLISGSSLFGEDITKLEEITVNEVAYSKYQKMILQNQYKHSINRL